MQSLRIEPAALKGRITAQPSKSMAHRLVVCAFLANGKSVIDNVVLSDDIRATIGACETLGASISIEDCDKFESRKRVIVKSTGKERVVRSEINCMESGSTARFLMPVSRLSEEPVVFTGRGRLVERPFEVYRDIMRAKGVQYADTCGKMPIRLSGKLSPGEYEVKGDISSQFVSGLLFALPFLGGDSILRISGALESKGYVEMTLNALREFGVNIGHDDGFETFFIPGGQSCTPKECSVEGDWSQAAFFCVLGAISGNIAIDGLSMDSLQGDKAIMEIIGRMGAEISIAGSTLNIGRSRLKAVEVDASQCPDLVPAIAVAMALCEGRSVIRNAARLRIKESDRLHAVSTELNKLGARVEELPDGLVINGVSHFTGGKVDGWNDHRIVMALAIASSACEGTIELNGCDSVAKSYPDFWTDLKKLGGRFDGQHLG